MAPHVFVHAIDRPLRKRGAKLDKRRLRRECDGDKPLACFDFIDLHENVDDVDGRRTATGSGDYYVR